MPKMLTYEEARAFYDAFGTKQDKQSWYEEAALNLLCKHAEFQSAHNVLEFGCGTGAFAKRLLKQELGPSAKYIGFDISSEMIEIAQQMLKPHNGQARVFTSSGEPILDVPDNSQDRIIVCYVLDLLTEDDTIQLLREAKRVLEPRGLLCAVSLTPGKDVLSRLVSTCWTGIHRVNPKWVGGCRPINMHPLFSNDDWNIKFSGIVSPYKISSEVIIAKTN